MPLVREGDEAVLFGGTFDPPTRAHTAVGSMFAAQTCVVLFVPAARSPHKDDAPGAPDADRVRMLEIALHDAPRRAVWTDELDRGAPSYWVDTVRRAREWGGARGVRTGRFVIGADQAGAFHRWREGRWLFDHAEPAVVLRPPIDSIDRLVTALERTGAWSGDDLERWRSLVVEAPLIETSATTVRALLHDGDDDTLREHLDDGVLAHIRERGLYA